MGRPIAFVLPFFLGGDRGFRLVEAWIVEKLRTEGAYANSLTPLDDVQFLFKSSR